MVPLDIRPSSDKMIPLDIRLNNVFQALDIKASQFAREHDINRMTMHNVVSGKNRPNLDLLERMCAVEPRISAEYLLRGEGSPLRENQLITLVGTIEELQRMRASIIGAFDLRIAELSA